VTKGEKKMIMRRRRGRRRWELGSGGFLRTEISETDVL
jgi:hypothetical protein